MYDGKHAPILVDIGVQVNAVYYTIILAFQIILVFKCEHYCSTAYRQDIVFKVF